MSLSPEALQIHAELADKVYQLLQEQKKLKTVSQQRFLSIQELQKAETHAELREKFLKKLSDLSCHSPAVYFEIDSLKQIACLIASHPKDLFSGIQPSFALKDSELDIVTLENSPRFKDFMQDALGLMPENLKNKNTLSSFEFFAIFPVQAFSKTVGFFVVSNTSNQNLQNQRAHLKAELKLFEKIWEILELRPQTNQNFDPFLLEASECGPLFYPISTFDCQLEFEVDLAQRYEHSLSLLALKTSSADIALEKFLQSQFRESDFYTKTAEGFYLMGLRHCSLARALNKAQNFVTHLQKEALDFSGKIAVSEYPGTASNHTTLKEQAIEFLSDTSTSIIINAKPSKGYLAPFQPQQIRSSPAPSVEI